MVTNSNNHSNQKETDILCHQPYLNDHPRVGDQVSDNHQKQKEQARIKKGHQKCAESQKDDDNDSEFVQS